MVVVVVVAMLVAMEGLAEKAGRKMGATTATRVLAPVMGVEMAMATAMATTLRVASPRDLAGTRGVVRGGGEPRLRRAYAINVGKNTIQAFPANLNDCIFICIYVYMCSE
jgi:hypothetical protein